MNVTPVKIRAIYADTDAMGIVYHTNYIRWFEVGRTELFRDMGICSNEAEGFNLPLTQVYCHYLLPARYDDLILVETAISYLRRASMKFSYVIYDEESEKKLAEGYTIHAFTNQAGKIIRIPGLIAGKIFSFHPKLKGE